MSDIKHIPIEQIVSDRSLQMREEQIDWSFVETLAEAIREGAEMPPIALFSEPAIDQTQGGKAIEIHHIGDGWHRFSAYMQLQKDVPAIVRPGGRAAALAHAVGANADQLAKPRTRKDIRRAVITAINTYMLGKDAKSNTQQLRDLAEYKLCIETHIETKATATQAEIAALCKTTQQTVSRILKELKAKAKAEAATFNDSTSEAKAPTQLDFWERFQLDTIEVANSAKALLLDRTRWKLMEQEPEKAAEALDAAAQALAQEVKAIKKAARDIRTGIQSSR